MKVEIRAGSQRLEAQGKEVSGGRQYLLPIPKQADLLTVSALAPDGNGGPTWSLRLAEPEKPAWLDQVYELFHGGRIEEAKQLLIRLRKSAPHKEQGQVLNSLAYLARYGGDHKAEERYLQQGLEADQATNCWSGEVQKATWLAGLFIDQGRFSEARQILEPLQLPPGAMADSKYLVAYHRGLLGDAVGDYRSALEQLQEAVDLAERIEKTKDRWQAEQILARLFQDLGRTQDALKLFVALRADPKPKNPCDLGILLTNWGWSLLRAREAGEPAEDPTPILRTARDEFDKQLCPPELRLNAHLNLAFAHQQAGQWSEARQALDQARALAIEPNLVQGLWWDDLKARAAIVDGHPERALGLYENLEERAKLALSQEGRFRASLGLAKARLALGQREAAIGALAEADRRLDEQSWHIPAHEGRETFLAQREEATRLYLQVLLDGEQWQEAFNLVRRTRSRLLRQLAVRDRLAQLSSAEQQNWVRLLSKYRELRDAVDRQAARKWQLARDEEQRAEEDLATQLAAAQAALDSALASLGDPGEGALSPPGPGEVILAYHPLPKGKWAGFAATQGGIEVATFPLPHEIPADPEKLSRILLGPFHSALEASGRVRILPSGSLRTVDFHTLPFAGEPLLARHLVVYGLDLPARSSSAPARRRAVLLVANPLGDLPAAQQEATVVDAAVRAWRPEWSLKRLYGTDARAPAVLRALPVTNFFHYAGHGIFAGFAGWDSELPLANDTRLTLGDVLALRQAPAWVVLSSCDAGRSAEEAPGEGIGLANAFLLAGSQAVVAATRRVEDRSTRDLMRELYAGWQPGLDLPRQLQRAQLASRRKDPSPGAAWANFRLLVP